MVEYIGENMIYVDINDFYEKARLCNRLTRKEEIECAKKMKDGDTDARERLIQSYIPMVANHIKHMKPYMHNLGMVIYCMQALEKAVDSFDFMQENEPFSHRLSWWLRQAVVNYIVK